MVGPTNGFKAPKSEAGKNYLEQHGNPVRKSMDEDFISMVQRFENQINELQARVSKLENLLSTLIPWCSLEVREQIRAELPNNDM